jgi:hypothetical protein
MYGLAVQRFKRITYGIGAGEMDEIVLMQLL